MYVETLTHAIRERRRSAYDESSFDANDGTKILRYKISVSRASISVFFISKSFQPYLPTSN